MAKEAASHIDTLKACPLFKGFSESGMNLVARVMRKRLIPAGSPIFVQSMVSDAAFILCKGKVSLSIKPAQGNERIISEINPIEAFGELSLIIGGTRMMTATAGTDCEILEIPRRDFVKLQKQKPQACLKLMLNIIRQFASKTVACRDILTPLLLSQLPGDS